MKTLLFLKFTETDITRKTSLFLFIEDQIIKSVKTVDLEQSDSFILRLGDDPKRRMD